jgi:hypothetical protein
MNPEELATAAEVAAPVESSEPVHVTGVSLTVASEKGVGTFAQLDPSLGEEARRDAVLDLLKKSQDAGAVLELVQGELLCEVKSNEYWKFVFDADGVAYTSFDKYVEQELNVKPKTAFNRIATYEALVIKAGLDASKLADVPLSKIPFVAKYLTAETAPAILDAVKSLSFRDMPNFAKALSESATVEDAVGVVTKAKEAKITGPADASAAEPTSASGGGGAAGGGSEDGGVKSFTVKMSASQHQACTEALKTIMASLGTESMATALESALLEVCSGLPAGPMSTEDKQLKITQLIDAIERTYSVKLAITSLGGEE